MSHLNSLYLKLLLFQTSNSGPLNFEIMRIDCIIDSDFQVYDGTFENSSHVVTVCRLDEQDTTLVSETNILYINYVAKDDPIDKVIGFSAAYHCIIGM